MPETLKTGIDFRIPWARPFLGEQEKEYLLSALDSTWISNGAFVDRLEENFCRYIDGGYGLAVSSGTAALQLAVLASNIGPGDEVIVPGFSFATPANVVMGVGAKPVYADVDPQTWCVDVRSIEACITPKTKAIIAVHIYGNVCDMPQIMALARRHNLVVIEDAAEAVLSSVGGRYAGTWGDFGCFSFHATKTITTGEGGFVVSRDGELIERMRMIRDHGMNKDKRYWHDIVGFNFRLTNLQAALGCAQLEKADEIITRRKQVYARYCRNLASIANIGLQQFKPDVDPVIWAAAVRVESARRDALMKAFSDDGIETRPGFFPFSAMPVYNAPFLKTASRIGEEIILLPLFAELTAGQVDEICCVFKNAVET